MEYTFKITHAEIKGDNVVVFASFFKGKNKIHEIIHSFPKRLGVNEISNEVSKALNLYVSELSQNKDQKKVDEEMEKDKELINNLIK